VSIAQLPVERGHLSPQAMGPGRLGRFGRLLRCPLCGADIQASRRLLHVSTLSFSTFSIEHSPYEARHRALSSSRPWAGRRPAGGLYYSLSNWAHPNYPSFEETDSLIPAPPIAALRPRNWELYLEYVKGRSRSC